MSSTRNQNLVKENGVSNNAKTPQTRKTPAKGNGKESSQINMLLSPFSMWSVMEVEMFVAFCCDYMHTSICAMGTLMKNYIYF